MRSVDVVPRTHAVVRRLVSTITNDATHILNQQQHEAPSAWTTAQEDLANRRAILDEEVAAIDEERRSINDKTSELRQDFFTREVEITNRCKKIAAENKQALAEKKRLGDEYKSRMTAMSSQKLLLE